MSEQVQAERGMLLRPTRARLLTLFAWWAASISASAILSPPCGVSWIGKIFSGFSASITSARSLSISMLPSCRDPCTGTPIPPGPTKSLSCAAAASWFAREIMPCAAGIAAVTARLQTGRLKVLADRCPHLLDEARLYRYPSPSEREADQENPIDEHNHALAALRYLVSRLDHHFMVGHGAMRGTTANAEPRDGEW